MRQEEQKRSERAVVLRRLVPRSPEEHHGGGDRTRVFLRVDLQATDCFSFTSQAPSFLSTILT